MRIPVTLFTVFLGISLCSAAIVRNELGLFTGFGIDISENSTIPVDDECEVPPAINAEAYERPKCGISDFYFVYMGYWDNGGQGCGGDIIGIESYDTLWHLNEPLSEDISIGQVLSDTSRFTVSYTNAENPFSSTTWSAVCPLFKKPCSWDTDWMPQPPVWYLSKTREGTYVLFRFISEQREMRNAPAEESGSFVTITYIHQTDGSLDFGEKPVPSSAPVPRTQHNPRNPSQPLPQKEIQFDNQIISQDTYRLYDLRGRLIKAPENEKHRLNSGTNVLITKKKNRNHSRNR